MAAASVASAVKAKNVIVTGTLFHSSLQKFLAIGSRLTEMRKLVVHPVSVLLLYGLWPPFPREVLRFLMFRP